MPTLAYRTFRSLFHPLDRPKSLLNELTQSLAKIGVRVTQTLGYGENDPANNYLKIHSSALDKLNSQKRLLSPYQAPAFRIFHNEGVITFGDPDEITEFTTPFIPRVISTALVNLLESSGNNYKNIDIDQQFGNSLSATVLGAFAI